MNSLDVYCLLHFKDKQFYAAMVEMGLMLDRNDFLPNGYLVDEEKYPRTAAKSAGRKGKAVTSSSQQETEVMEDKEDNALEEDNRIDVSDDEIGPPGGSEPPHSGAHLTSPDADREVLRKRTVKTPRTLFGDDAMVERVELPPPGPIVETRQAKRAKQTSPPPSAEPSSSVVADDNVSAKLLALEERVQRMTESNFSMQASLQQSLADQARVPGISSSPSSSSSSIPSASSSIPSASSSVGASASTLVASSGADPASLWTMAAGGKACAPTFQ